jgi:hypothetical protein
MHHPDPACCAVGAKRKVFDLDVENDPFFARYAGTLFPEAIQANSAELNEVSSRRRSSFAIDWALLR